MTAPRYFQTIPVAPGGGNSGNAVERKQATFTSNALVNGASETNTIPIAKGFQVLNITTNVPARVRLYTRAGYATRDLSRPVGQLPAGDHGLIADLLTYSSKLSWDFAPIAPGSSLEDPPTANIPIVVTNSSGSTHVINVTVTYLELEA